MQAPSTALPTTLVPVAPPAFSVGRTISQTLGLWARHAVPLAIVTLIIDVPGFALEVARVRPGGGESPFSGGQTMLDSLIGIVTTIAITFGVIEARRGERPRVGALLAIAARRFGPVFVVGFAASFLALLGTVALVVPGLVAFTGFYVAVPVAIAEPQREAKAAFGALRRSWELTRGRRLRILLLAATSYGAFFVVVIGASFLANALLSATTPYVAVSLVRVFAGIAAGVLFTTPAVAYLDLRAEKEGIPVEELVRVFD